MSSETGATPEQIEAAVERYLNRTSWVEEARDAHRQSLRDEALLWAPLFVPPGYRIVGPDAVVLTAAENLGGDGVSENVYRLTLTERERTDALDAIDAWMNQNCDAHEVWRRVWDLYRKIDALEPVGTDGEGK